MADLKKKISELPDGTPVGTDIVPYVDLLTGETKKALKSELDGIDGKTILNGTIDPTTEGVDGDFYINTATNTIFGPKTAGVWGSGTSIIGDTGNGIDNIALIDTTGLVKTYRITYTDTTIFDYTTTDGIDGTNAPEVQFEYSVDGTTLFHTPFEVGDFYIRESTDGGTTWSAGMKFIGTDGTGAGDMTKATYDPTNKSADAFAMDNMVEGATTKILTDVEKTNIANNKLHTQAINNPHGVTKTQVGLANVDNTSDVDKPISTATQSALDNKENTFIKNTAFNKDFGTTSGTVLEGNTNVGIVGTKTVDETNIADAKVLAYSATSGQIEYITPSSGGASFNGGNGINTSFAGQVAQGILFRFSPYAAGTFNEFRVSAETITSGTATFTVKKNGTAIGTVSLVSTDTATNGLYIKTSTDLADTFAIDDNITVEYSDDGIGLTNLLFNIK